MPQTVARLLFQAPPHQSSNHHRSRGWQGIPVRRALDHGRDHVRSCVAIERAAACEHLVEHAPEGPDIRPLIDSHAARLFGAHVGRRPDHRAVIGERRAAGSGLSARRRVQRLGESKVEHFHGAVGPDRDVGGL